MFLWFNGLKKYISSVKLVNIFHIKYTHARFFVENKSNPNDNEEILVAVAVRITIMAMAEPDKKAHKKAIMEAVKE